MSWRTRVRTSLLYLVAIVAGFSLAYLVVAFVIFPAGVVPRDVKVPNVAGLTYEEAQQRLAQAGFTAEQGEMRFNNSAPKGTVLEQTPPPGSREGVGGGITLVVSGGARTVAVPTVTGMSRADAQTELENAGFVLGDVSQSPSQQPYGTVIGTRPPVGTQVSVPSTINLVLSGGAATTTMPDLMGRGVDAARQTLMQVGVRNIQLVNDPTSADPPGTVSGQSPVPGAALPPGASVQLRVSGGQAP